MAWAFVTDKVPGCVNPAVGRCALAFGDRIIQLGRQGEVRLFRDGAWHEIYANGDVATTVGVMLCVDSRGNVYFSHQASGGLWRSTDLGETFTKVYDCQGVAADVRAVDEDYGGTLYLCEYDTDATGDIGYVARSFDGGATWEDISANLAVTYDRHTHVIRVDPYRGALILSGGDGSNNHPQWSTDRGDTWHAWTTSQQITEIIPTPKYVYFCDDQGDSRDITRASELGGEIESVYTPDVNESSVPANGFVWLGEYIPESGEVWAAYQGGDRAFIVASSDARNTSWERVYEGVSGSNELFISERVFYTAKAKHDGRFKKESLRVSFDTTPTPANSNLGSMLAWQVYPKTARDIFVDANAGSFMGDGWQVPRKEILDDADIAETGKPVTLASNYPRAVWIENIALFNGQGKYEFSGAAESATNAETEDFEGALGAGWSTATIGTGTVDATETSNPRGGSRHLRTAISGGSGANGGYVRRNFPLAIGDELWMEGYFYLTDPSLSGSEFVTLMQTDGPTNNEIRVMAGGAIAYFYFDPVNGASVYHQSVATRAGAETFTFGAYVKVRARLLINDRAGRCTVWLNDRLAGDWIGAITSDSTNDDIPNGVRFGLKTNIANATLDVDDIRVQTTADPRANLQGAVFRAQGTRVVGLAQKTRQVLMSGQSQGWFLGCVSFDCEVDAPYKLTAANSKFVQGVCVNGTHAVEATTTNQEIKNSIFVGQSTAAIRDTATPVVGGNIYFDTAYGMTAAASDLNIDPELVNPQAGDFSPRAASALTSGVNWWGTVPPPVDLVGEPFPSWDISIGAIQSRDVPSHPKKI